MYTEIQAKYVTPEAFEQMTDAQRAALDRVLSRWSIILTPFQIMGIGPDKYLFGQVGYFDGIGSMWLGIEHDGYTHS